MTLSKDLFEDFLREVHAKDYHGTDDNMPEAFDAWLDKLEPPELIALGNAAMEGLLK